MPVQVRPARGVKVRIRKKKSKKIFPYLIIFALVAVALYIFKINISKKPVEKNSEPTAISAVTNNTDNHAPVNAVSAPKKADLSQQINAIISSYPNTDISVAMIDINADKSFSFGLNQKFLGASTTKVLTAIATLKDVEAGRYSLNSPLGSATVGWQLKQMINRSNNDSWALLDNKIGTDRLIAYSKSIGAPSFDFYTNSINTADEAKVLASLYEGQLLNSANTNLLLSYMQNTNNEDLIPAGLTVNTVFYHKYGQYLANLHDSAIIKAKNPFALVIFTNANSANYSVQAGIIQIITKTIFEYQNS